MEEASFIFAIADTWSYLGIFVLALIANSFPAIPEEVFILALGYLGATPAFNMYYIGIIAFLGLFISDCVIFYLARTGAKFYTKVISRLFGSSAEKVTQSSFAKRHIKKIIFLSRFVFQLRFIGPFLAGHYQVPWKTFLKYDIPALLLYVPLMLFIGSYFRDRVERIISGTGVIKNYILIFAAIILFIILVRSIRNGMLKSLMDHHQVRRVTSWFGFSKVEDVEKEEDAADINKE